MTKFEIRKKVIENAMEDYQLVESGNDFEYMMKKFNRIVEGFKDSEFILVSVIETLLLSSSNTQVYWQDLSVDEDKWLTIDEIETKPDLENISALVIYMPSCKKAPKYYIKEIEPKNINNMAWIPQTIGDQLWVLYEFYSKEERLEWESSLPEDVFKYLKFNRAIIPQALKFGWKIRDMNGFEVV